LAFKASRGIEDKYELTYIRKDGSRFPAIVSVTALRNAEGGIIGYLLIGTDNSARKQVEEKLRWTEEGFRLMVESVTDCAIVMLDSEGRVVSWNTGAQRIKGYPAEEIVGQHFSRFYPPADIARGVPQRDLNSAASEGRFEVEGWRVRKDGSMFWANVVFTAIRDQAGNARGFAKLTRDLTERRQVEQTLTTAKGAAEKANLAKSEFLSSMSHELRSPLNAILGFAQLMESDATPATPSQKASIAEILRAGWYLLELINEILDLAQIESGKLSLSPEPTSLAEVILECQAMIEPQAQTRGIRMTFPQFDVPCFVAADRTRLKQVLINLLSNAIKYNKQGGTVVVDCAGGTAERIRLNVRDTGPGLSPEKLAQLFQPFNRLGQEHGTEQGTGIGLVMSKRLAELMGGVLGVESRVGGGSVFWCELGAAAAPELEAMTAKPEPVGRAQAQPDAPLRTLLYVEDNPANLKLVEQLIARRPTIRLLTAVDGNMGIQLARGHQPDVILMDINLPGISGIEALKILRDDPATAHIPIVALSANAMPRDIAKGLEAGFFSYLTKPIKVKEFMEALDAALGSVRAHA
jgi:PAS domain S-box-containing protein